MLILSHADVHAALSRTDRSELDPVIALAELHLTLWRAAAQYRLLLSLAEADLTGAALRDLLNQRHAATDGAFAPARVLNLVVVVDADYRGEVENRLERVGRYHPSRTIVCAIDEGRFTLLASDAYRETYLEIALWDGRSNQLARESLYEDDDEDE